MATLLVTMVLVAFGASRTPSLEQVSSVGFALGYLAFIGVLYSMLAWNFGARRIGLLNASLLINFMPVVTFLYRAAQGHPIKTTEVAGAALVVSALIANNVYLRRRHVREAGHPSDV